MSDYATSKFGITDVRESWKKF